MRLQSRQSLLLPKWLALLQPTRSMLLLVQILIHANGHTFNRILLRMFIPMY